MRPSLGRRRDEEKGFSIRENNKRRRFGIGNRRPLESRTSEGERERYKNGLNDV